MYVKHANPITKRTDGAAGWGTIKHSGCYYIVINATGKEEKLLAVTGEMRERIEAELLAAGYNLENGEG